MQRHNTIPGAVGHSTRTWNCIVHAHDHNPTWNKAVMHVLLWNHTHRTHRYHSFNTNTTPDAAAYAHQSIANICICSRRNANRTHAQGPHIKRLSYQFSSSSTCMVQHLQAWTSICGRAGLFPLRFCWRVRHARPRLVRNRLMISCNAAFVYSERQKTQGCVGSR